MKKLSILFVMLFVLFAVGVGYAEDVRLGVSTSSQFLIDRDMDLKGSDEKADLSVNQYTIQADVTLKELFTISPKIGLLNGFELDGPDGILKADTGFVYGVDTKTVLPLNLPVDLAVLTELTAAKLDAKNATEENMDILGYGVELQASKTLTLSKIPGKITPILGLRYSDLKIDGAADVKADDNWGMTVGGKYDYNDMFGVSVKGKFVDQTAIEVAGTVRF